MTIRSILITILTILTIKMALVLICNLELLKCDRATDSVTLRPGSREALASKNFLLIDIAFRTTKSYDSRRQPQK